MTKDRAHGTKGQAMIADSVAAPHHRHYVPAMGQHWLLPLYDPLQRLLGIGTMHRWLLDQAGVRPGQRVLEIGCGTGNLALLVKRLQPQAEVVGIDPDPQALARARSKAARESLTVQLDRGFAERLPYPDASFDHVLSALMLHHLTSDQQVDALREARRTLRPRGALHLLDFTGSTVHSDGLLTRLHHRSRRMHHHFGDGIPALMREAGFEDATEAGHRVTRIIGRLTYFRATAPDLGRPS
jgi:ubiquinone/menaquinone biosynthesis C-methylase UbiE